MNILARSSSMIHLCGRTGEGGFFGIETGHDESGYWQSQSVVRR